MQNDVLSTLATGSKDDRLDFMRKLLDCTPLAEIAMVKNLVTNAVKRKKRRGESQSQSTAKKPRPGAVAPESKVASAPASTVPPKAWFTAYKKSQIITLDCEMVHLHELNLEGKHIVKAATVAIRNFNYELIYSVSKLDDNWLNIFKQPEFKYDPKIIFS